MRVALFASPDFGLPVLDALHRHFDLALVVAQPDKAAGRGLKLNAPPIARRARELGLRLEQPAKLKNNGAFCALLQRLELDVAVTAAYGKILPEPLLGVPRHGFLNVHASLLPAYRGAAPIQAALIDGLAETGVTIMQTEAGLDTGPIRLQRALKVHPDETAPELSARLATLGAEALLEALERLERGELPLVPQNDERATHAGLLTKEDGRVRWRDSARAIYNRFRGVYAWPGTWTLTGGTGAGGNGAGGNGPNGASGQRLKLLELRPVPGESAQGEGVQGEGVQGEGAPGEVLEVAATGVLVAAGEGAVLLEAVQPPGKPRMSAQSWANGYNVGKGYRLG